jgi:hypothetical protein
MKFRVLGLIAVFATALTASAAMDAAEARRGGHGGGHARSFSAPRMHAHVGPRMHRGVHYVPMRPRQFHRNYFHAGPRYVTDRCAWLRHRALATGSRVWWQRYYACRNGIYY